MTTSIRNKTRQAHVPQEKLEHHKDILGQA